MLSPSIDPAHSGIERGAYNVDAVADARRPQGGGGLHATLPHRLYAHTDIPAERLALDHHRGGASRGRQGTRGRHGRLVDRRDLREPVDGTTGLGVGNDVAAVLSVTVDPEHGSGELRVLDADAVADLGAPWEARCSHATPLSAWYIELGRPAMIAIGG